MCCQRIIACVGTGTAVGKASRRARRDARDLNRTATAFANRAVEDNKMMIILETMDQEGKFTRDTLRGVDAGIAQL